MVVDSFLDGPDGKLQGAVSYLTGFRAHLGWFHVDELLLLQQANVLSEVHTTAQEELFQPESNPQSETSRKLTPGEIFNDFSLGILDSGKRKGPTLHHFF